MKIMINLHSKKNAQKWKKWKVSFIDKKNSCLFAFRLFKCLKTWKRQEMKKDVKRVERHRKSCIASSFNFTNVYAKLLRTQIPKGQNLNTIKQSVFFVYLGSARVKSTRKPGEIDHYTFLTLSNNIFSSSDSKSFSRGLKRQIYFIY